MEEQSLILKGRLDGKQRVRLGKLLDMMYRPSELANEIGFTVRQVYRVYIPAGCPHEKDSRGHVWINGRAFKTWAEQFYQKRGLSENEAFCLTCKKPVVMKDEEKKQKGGLLYWVCVCPDCGRKLARIIDKDHRVND